MLSVDFIREHADEVREALRKRHMDAPLDDVLRLDAERRRVIPQLESLLAERNVASKQIGQTRDPAVRDALMQIPNMPLPQVPEGPDETANVEVRRGNVPVPEFGFPVQPHWDIGERLGIIDFEAGVKMSGSRFYVLKGMGALLQRALINLMVDMHVYEHGLELIKPPTVVKEECLWATGDLPKFLDNLYHDYEDDLWLIPTAEVPLTNLWRDEIVEPGVLPLRYVS